MSSPKCLRCTRLRVAALAISLMLPIVKKLPKPSFFEVGGSGSFRLQFDSRGGEGKVQPKGQRHVRLESCRSADTLPEPTAT
jgi:hypothetical protein